MATAKPFRVVPTLELSHYSVRRVKCGTIWLGLFHLRDSTFLCETRSKRKLRSVRRRISTGCEELWAAAGFQNSNSVSITIDQNRRLFERFQVPRNLLAPIQGRKTSNGIRRYWHDLELENKEIFITYIKHIISTDTSSLWTWNNARIGTSQQLNSVTHTRFQIPPALHVWLRRHPSDVL